jgi:hypothetical protein
MDTTETQGSRTNKASRNSHSSDTGDPFRIHARAAYRRGEVGSSPPPSAIDSRIDESAWMFFMR